MKLFWTQSSDVLIPGETRSIIQLAIFGHVSQVN